MSKGENRLYKISLLKKWLVVGTILSFFGVCFIPATAQDIEKFQSISKGSWLYVGGSGPGNYTKIQDAVEDASVGDTVFVFTGFYKENIFISKSIVLLGENRDNTIIDANGSGCPILIGLFYSHYYSYVSGFTLQNGSSGIARYLDYRYCDNVTIINNKIINNYEGIDISCSSNISIQYNIITKNEEHGISCTVSNFVNIENNEITDSTVAIELSDSYQCHILNNFIDRNEYGIDLWNTTFYNISDNTLSNSSATGIYLQWSYNNYVHSNDFINNNEDVFFLYDYQHNPTRNYFVNNYWDRHNRIGPKIIFGIKCIYVILLNEHAIPPGIPIIIPWVNCDWHPAKKPNNIHRAG